MDATPCCACRKRPRHVADLSVSGIAALVEIFLDEHYEHISSGCTDNGTVRFDAIVSTDLDSEDTSWVLNDESGKVIASRAAGSYFEPTSSTNDWVCRDRDGSSYTFTLFNAYNDGLCCDIGFGHYSGYLDGIEVFRGGEFYNTESVQHTFVVQNASNPSEDAILDNSTN